MCPLCIALLTAGATSAGGLTIFAIKKHQGKDKAEKNPAPSKTKEKSL